MCIRDSLIFEIQNLLDVGKGLFLERLPILMISLPEKVMVTKDDCVEEEYTSKILEETLFPLSNKFSFEEWKEVETILKL